MSSNARRWLCRDCAPGWPTSLHAAASRMQRAYVTASRRWRASSGSCSASTGCEYLRCCILVPSADAGFVRAIFLAGGRVAALRSLPPGEGARLEVEAGTDCVVLRARGPPARGGRRRPARYRHVSAQTAPELRVAPLDLDPILRRAAELPRALGGADRGSARARAA